MDRNNIQDKILELRKTIINLKRDLDSQKGRGGYQWIKTIDKLRKAEEQLEVLQSFAISNPERVPASDIVPKFDSIIEKMQDIIRNLELENDQLRQQGNMSPQDVMELQQENEQLRQRVAELEQKNLKYITQILTLQRERAEKKALLTERKRSPTKVKAWETYEAKQETASPGQKRTKIECQVCAAPAKGRCPRCLGPTYCSKACAQNDLAHQMDCTLTL